MMKHFLNWRSVAAAAGLAACAALAGPAAAAPCSPSNMTGASACEANIPGTKSGKVSVRHLNLYNGAGVFDHNGWEKLERVKVKKGDGEHFSVSANSQRTSGTLTFKPELQAAADRSYVAVLKGRKANVAYALDTVLDTASWTNADLIRPSGKNGKVGSITLYARPAGDDGSPSQVPLPAAAWLMIAGMAGLGAVSRGRRQAQA